VAKENKFSGVQKAAILFITLGAETASGIMKKLHDNEIQKITYEIANITSVKSEQRQSVLDEFIEINKARDYILEGGVDYARAILAKALGSQRAADIMEKVVETSHQFRPFAIARKADAFQLMNVISNEHPQTIALVLCYLQPDKAGQILSSLPEDIQSEVSYRIATMNNTSPILLKEIENVLESKLSSVIRSDTLTIGGVESLVDILNTVDRTTEKNITEELERFNQELAEKVKESMFVFEDVITLDDVYIQRVLREVDVKELALALKGCSEEVSILYLRINPRGLPKDLRKILSI
jgi:flagellar motor switch protein FliG